jgi:hypothetical protein
VLYVLTHAATEEFNALGEEFEAAGSEIETVARDDIGGAFWIVATAHGVLRRRPRGAHRHP